MAATRKFVIYLHKSNEFNQNIYKNDSHNFYFERMDIYIRVGENMQKLDFCIVGCKICVCLLIVSFVVNFVQDSLIMFGRNRLPDSVRRRTIEWMEMGL